MTEVCAKRRRWAASRTADAALLAGVLAVLLSPSGVPAANASPATPSLHPSFLDSTGANLTVDPTSFWMRTGSNVTIRGLWSAESPLCVAAPLWFQWSVGNGTATGFLNTTTGPAVTFTAESFESGTVGVTVRSATALECGSNQTVLEGESTTNLSIVVPLRVFGLELEPLILTPGENATLTGNVTGGVGPYLLHVSWGDGTYSTVPLATSGTFSLNHTFPAGEFAPFVLGSDSEGDLSNVSVPEAASVGTGLRVAIVPQSTTAEVGTPVGFLGWVEDPPPGMVTLHECSDTADGSAAPPSGSPNSTAFSCTFSSPGTAVVFFGAFPASPGGPSASAVLYESVVALPAVIVSPVESVGEVNGSLEVRVGLTGGALPVSLSWNLTGNRSSGTAVVASDGTGVLIFPLTAAGAYSVGIRALDSLGGAGANTTALVQVDPSLDAGANGARSFLADAVAVQVAGAVFSGCSPFSWWAVPAVAPTNGSVGNGTLDTVGGFAWSEAYAQEGNLTVTVAVTDACGATWQVVLVVPLIPILSVVVTATAPSPSSNATIILNLSVEGGWPPFRMNVNTSRNESWNRTIRSDGTDRFVFQVEGNGSLVLSVSLTDSFGNRVESNLTVVVPSPGPVASPPRSPPSGSSENSSTNSWAISEPGLLASLFVSLGIITLIAVVWRRRARGRKASGKTPPVDPVTTLKGIIEPAEGAERFTVELLAEEAGIPLSDVRSTLDRLISEGKVRSESGADGEEVLSWSTEHGP